VHHEQPDAGGDTMSAKRSAGFRDSQRQSSEVGPSGLLVLETVKVRCL